MFHNVELLSWGHPECPIQMHFFLEHPLGSKHIVEMFWIFKALAQFWGFLSVNFLSCCLFISFFNAFFFLIARSPFFYHPVVASTQKVFLQGCFSVFRSFSCSPNCCATNKSMPLSTKYLWKGEDKTLSNREWLEVTNF